MTGLSRSTIVTLICIVSVLCVLGYFTYERISPQGRFADLQNDLKEIQPDQPFYTDLNGNVVDLITFKGKPLIINSWATWMPFSKDELLLLASLKEKYGETVQIIAINRMEPIERIQSYKNSFSLPDNILFLADPLDHFYKAVGGYAMPETIYYASDGTIVRHTRGTLNKDELTSFMDTFIMQ